MRGFSSLAAICDPGDPSEGSTATMGKFNKTTLANNFSGFSGLKPRGLPCKGLVGYCHGHNILLYACKPLVSFNFPFGSPLLGENPTYIYPSVNFSKPYHLNPEGTNGGHKKKTCSVWEFRVEHLVVSINKRNRI